MQEVSAPEVWPRLWTGLPDCCSVGLMGLGLLMAKIQCKKMKKQTIKSQRELDKLCKQMWNESAKGQCLMKGLKTSNGNAPNYCGPAPEPQTCRNHTIADNIIRAADVNRSGRVVTFRPATTIKPRSTEGARIKGDLKA